MDGILLLHSRLLREECQRDRLLDRRRAEWELAGVAVAVQRVTWLPVGGPTLRGGVAGPAATICCDVAVWCCSRRSHWHGENSSHHCQSHVCGSTAVEQSWWFECGRCTVATRVSCSRYVVSGGKVVGRGCQSRCARSVRAVKYVATRSYCGLCDRDGSVSATAQSTYSPPHLCSSSCDRIHSRLLKGGQQHVGCGPYDTLYSWLKAVFNTAQRSQPTSERVAEQAAKRRESKLNAPASSGHVRSRSPIAPQRAHTAHNSTAIHPYSSRHTHIHVSTCCCCVIPSIDEFRFQATTTTSTLANCSASTALPLTTNDDDDDGVTHQPHQPHRYRPLSDLLIVHPPLLAFILQPVSVKLRYLSRRYQPQVQPSAAILSVFQLQRIQPSTTRSSVNSHSLLY